MVTVVRGCWIEEGGLTEGEFRPAEAHLDRLGLSKGGRGIPSLLLPSYSPCSPSSPPRSLNLTFATNATLPEPPLGPASVCLTNHPSHPPLAWRNPRVSVTHTCIRAFTCHVRVWRGVTMATHPHHGGETPLAGAGSRPIVAHPCLCLCIGVHVSTYVSASPRNEGWTRERLLSSVQCPSMLVSCFFLINRREGFFLFSFQ